MNATPSDNCYDSGLDKLAKQKREEKGEQASALGKNFCPQLCRHLCHSADRVCSSRTLLLSQGNACVRKMESQQLNPSTSFTAMELKQGSTGASVSRHPHILVLPIPTYLCACTKRRCRSLSVHKLPVLLQLFSSVGTPVQEV